MGQPTVIYRVPDADDADYDIFLTAPSAMPLDVAVALIDAAVLKVQEANPDEFTDADLMEELYPHGFRSVDVMSSNERF